MPTELTGVGVDRQDGIRVQARSRPAQRRRPRVRLSRTEVDQSQLGVVADGVPGGAAERWHLAHALRPRLPTGLALSRHRVELPLDSARLGVVRSELAAHARVASGPPHEDLAVSDERRMRVPSLVVEVTRPRLPHLHAGAGVERDQVRVGRAPVDVVSVQRDTAMLVVRLRSPDVVGVLPLVHPAHVSGRRVERGDPPEPLGDVHDTVRHDRGRHPACGRLDRVRPYEPQLVDVVPVDLVERAIALHVVRAPVAHPVPVLRSEQTLLRDRLPLGPSQGRRRAGRQKRRERGGPYPGCRDHQGVTVTVTF